MITPRPEIIAHNLDIGRTGPSPRSNPHRRLLKRKAGSYRALLFGPPEQSAGQRQNQTRRPQLKGEAETELDLALGEGRGEGQWRAGRNRAPTRKRRPGPKPMNGESREPWRQAKQWAYFIVHAGEVGPVGDVKSFRRKLHIRLVTEFVSPGQAHVEVDVVGAQARVARCADGTLVGGVIVAVYLASRQ